VQTIDPISAVEITEGKSQLTEVLEQQIRATSSHPGWRGRYAQGLCLIDWGVGLVAASAALLLRFGSYGVQPFLWEYLLLTVLFPLAWIAALGINRAYESRHLFVGTDEYARVVRSGIGLTAAMAIFSFAFDLRLASGYVLIAVPLVTLADVGARYVFRQLLHRSWSRGERLHRVILVGHARAVADMTGRLRHESHHGLGIIGACLPPGAAGEVTAGLPPIYGNFDDVAAAVTQSGADTVVVLSCPEIDGAALRRLAWQLERDEIDLIVASTLVDVAGDRTTIRPVDGLPMLHVEHPRLKGSARLVKAAFDRVGALVLLALGAPLLAVVAALVMFGPGGGRGPAIFRQERVGKDGRPFVLFKFRTMVVNAEARLPELRNLNDTDGELFKLRNDPRVTPVGQFLRRYSLDELPQLMNVLKGDMSLVGPRPPLAREVAGYPADMRRRLVVKPGLTGLWQVSGRSDLSWDESIRLDLTYVENWSLAMDLAILARTVSAVVRSSGAY
jgi:exopolysaccharide biosynthesis polyprenyl glycosylphosphotransferase